MHLVLRKLNCLHIFKTKQYILALLLCLFFLSSCLKKGKWEEASLPNSSSFHDLAKLSYPPLNPLYGIELELIRSGEALFGYLNVHHFEISPYEQNQRKAKVEFITEQKKRSFVLDRLEGGQRLRLSEEALQTLVALLQSEAKITIKFPPFLETIEAKEFHKLFSQLLKKPLPYFPETFITFDLY